MPVKLPRIVNRQYVGMTQFRCDLDFVQEAVDADDFSYIGTQNLDRDLAVMLGVASEVDYCHTASPDFPLDRVAVLGSLEVSQYVARHISNFPVPGYKV